MSQWTKSSTLIFYVNGKRIEVKDVDPTWSLLYFIRSELQLTGTKLSCGQGACGACTVMLSQFDRHAQLSVIKHYTVNACIFPLVCAHGLAITTVEGVGSTRTILHPVQERLAKCHGTQCGFCSPGMVMSMYALLRNTSNTPTEQQIEDAIQGNICRCTGYRPILDGFKTFSVDTCPQGENCCQNKSGQKNERAPMTLYDDISFKPLESSQEIIFPNELQIEDKFSTEPLMFKNSDIRWFRPVTLQEAIELMDTVYNSEWRMGHVLYGQSKEHQKNIISVGHLSELKEINISDSNIHIGAGTSLADLNTFLRYTTAHCKSQLRTTIESLNAMYEGWTSGCQLQNVSTIGGNLMSRKPTSNFVPMFMILNAEAVFYNKSREEVVPINNDLVHHMDKFSQSNGLLMRINIPIVTGALIGRYYTLQQSHPDGRSAIISVVFKSQVHDNGQFSNLDCVYAGLQKYPTLYTDICKESCWNGNPIESFTLWFNKVVAEKGNLSNYQTTIALNLFQKFHHDVQLSHKKGLTSGYVTEKIRPNQIEGSHVWELDSKKSSVGKPFPHQWALEHVTGEAKYIMDLPQFRDELYMVLVTSTKAHANILSIDTSQALAVPGVVDYISHEDVPGLNRLSMNLDEECFVTKEVTHIGHIIGGIVATTKGSAVKGARAVLIQYEELPVILSLKEAIEQKSFYPDKCEMGSGNLEEGFKNSDHVIEGEIELGGQEQYYMETQCALVVPKQEYSQFDVYASTQNPVLIQSNIATALGIAHHKVNVHTRRIGGGFGGKEFRSVLSAVPASVAAYKHNKPVRLSLDRDLDMETTGGRHPCYAKYKVGFTSDGKIQACSCDLYFNGGDTRDSTHQVIGNGVFQMDNCTNIPNFKAVGHACRTNLASNTAFRGFGVPQCIMAMETCLEKVARYLNMDFNIIHEVNFYKEGDKTHYEQPIKNCNILKCWNLVKETANFREKKDEIEEFNRQNTSRKRGLAITPVKFGLSYGGEPFLNQGSALVNVYTDGSVLVSHGGIEMGQGLNTKLIQIASETLGVPYSKVIIDEMNTSTIPNGIPTAASASTDLYGGAVKVACDTLNKRLESIKEGHPKVPWEELVTLAFMERISLSATGYYRPGGIDFDGVKKTGNAFRYFTFGAACSEVEVDVLTGEHKLLKTDIVFDIGNSINPAIDIGQIEGGFLQGYGYLCLEELLYDDAGKLLTTGPSSYRVPTARDIPGVLNVTLLKDHPNEKAVYSSKGIGEPPFLLGSSVYFAIKDAITSVRRERGLEPYFLLNCPASPKRVLHACNN